MQGIGERGDEGATAVEYGIMVALIAVVIFVAVVAVGQSLRENMYDCVVDALETMPAVGCTR